MSAAHPNTITVHWRESPVPGRYLAWVYVGYEFVGCLSMTPEVANEFHCINGDAGITEEDWNNVLV